MIIAGILAFAGIMSGIVTATLYTLDNTLTLHTTLKDWNTK